MIRIPGVLAQVEVDPSTDGMPGADLIQQLLNWAQMLALWGSLAALLIGAGIILFNLFKARRLEKQAAAIAV